MDHQHGSQPAPDARSADGHAADAYGEGTPRHSWWWMVACCAPMVLVALALLLGVFGVR